jgi:3-oxoacyl-[acyl-carrier protein] reductase
MKKVALVTGGGTGIGRAIVLKLAELGFDVAIIYSKSKAEAESTLKEVEDYGATGLICQTDVSNDTEVQAMVERVMAKFGRLDVLVNCAGVTTFVDLKNLEGLAEADWDRTFGVNAKGVFFTSRACAKELKRNNGAIINLVSVAGIKGKGSSMAYCASKAAAISITKSLAIALAPEVRVNGVAPGPVQTRWFAGQEAVMQKLSGDTPLGRIATPEDVAEVVVSLVLVAGFVTGQILVVDGGNTI